MAIDILSIIGALSAVLVVVAIFGLCMIHGCNNPIG